MLRSATVIACSVFGLAGCAESGQKGAEVPKAGPAAEPDPGPAPAGQSEPATTKAPSSDPDAALPSDRAIPFGGRLQTVGYAETSTDEVQVQVLDWKGVEKLIASHKGKVVVIDMWSLSCAPCRKEFPNLVKLHNDQSAQVACISVSTDYAGIKSKPPEFYKPKVLEFLSSQKATFENVLCSVDSETLFDQLSLVSIPAVYVYGKDGKLAQRFTGEEVHYDKEVLPLVESLLAK